MCAGHQGSFQSKGALVAPIMPSRPMRRSQVSLQVASFIFAICVCCGWAEHSSPTGVETPDKLPPAKGLLDEASPPATQHSERRPLPKRMLKQAPPGAALLLWGRSTVGLDLTEGDCSRTEGPFDHQPPVSRKAQALGLWSKQQMHIVCFMLNYDDHEGFKFITSRFAAVHDMEESGEFGFGEDIEVILRPEIETRAVWPLHEGVKSLGVHMQQGSTLRVLAVRTSNSGKVADMPVVVAQLPANWPLAVHFANSSMGKCTADPGASRIICNAEPDVAGSSAELLALCRTCAEQPDQAELQVSEVQGHPDVKKLDGATATTISKGLGGWVTEVPSEGMWRRWRLTLQAGRPANVTKITGRRLEAVTESFEVILVSGDSDLLAEHIAESELRFLLGAGSGLAQVAMVSLVLLAITIVFATILGLPTRLLAAVPAASASGLVLPFLALAGGLEGSPEALRIFAKNLSFMAPTDSPGFVLLAALLGILAVLFLHGYSVCWFIMLNGRGSAGELPHNLKFGAWELWPLTFLAFPLSAAATQIIVDLWLVQQDEFIWFPSTPSKIVGSVPGALIILALSLLVFFVQRQVSIAIDTGRVVCTVMPPPDAIEDEESYGHPVFVDRICDQLSAMPTGLQRSNLLGDWPAGPSWRFSPSITSIHPMEHLGMSLVKPSLLEPCGEWDSGPWQKLKAPPEGEGDEDEDHDPMKQAIKQLPIRNSKIVEDAMYRSISEAEMNAKGQGRPDDFMSMPGRSVATIALGSHSVVLAEHPVRVKTKFAYQAGRISINAVAGVRCLPWMDCVVPAKALCAIESLLGSVSLRTSAAQLVGPYTGGRLGACFHWGVRWPWQWSTDMALKVVLGIWVALSPHLSDFRKTWVIIVQVVALVVAVGCCILSILVRPYVHTFDNIATVLARIAVVLGMIIRMGGHFMPSVTPALVTAAAAIASVPLGVVFAAGCALATQVTLNARGQKGERGLAAATDQALAGQLSKDSDGSLHMLDVVIQDAHPGPSLPAWVHAPIVHYRLQPQAGRRGVCNQLPSDGKPWLAVAPSLLFPTVNARGSISRTAPIAALVEPPDEGRLVFAEADKNGGDSWREVARQFFSAIDESGACSREAEQIIQDFEIPQQAGEERTMVIIEAVPPSTELGTTIRIP